MTRIGFVVAAACAALVLSACSPDPSPPTPSTTTSVSASASASPTPSDTTEAAAAVAAEQVLRDYYRAQVECLADPPNTEPTCFDAVAIGTELINQHNALLAAQQAGTRAGGTIELPSVAVQSVDLTSDTAATPPTVPTVTFLVCVDVSGATVVDESGNSVLPPDRQDRVQVEVQVFDYEYPDPAQWRVGYVGSASDASC